MYSRTINSIILFVIICLSNPVTAGLETVEDNKNIASFELKSIDGQLHQLSDYQGRVVLVNFWASWCPPCIQEIPAMLRLEKSFLNRPFEVIAINVEEQKRKVIYQAKRNNMSFIVLLDTQSKTFKQWQAKILPTSFIVDKKGHIRDIAKGPLEWDSDEIIAIIEKLLME